MTASAGQRHQASAIYEGTVRHRRHAPRRHAFTYPMGQLFLDLDELSQVFNGHRLWSVDRRNVAEFRRSDYLGPPHIDLAQAVRQRVRDCTGVFPAGPIRLLTHPRYLGYVFNPVSFYYCYGADGSTLEHVVAEITNTPWGERHAYVLPVSQAQRRADHWVWAFPKVFHVSPFLPLARHYRWVLTTPGEELRVYMQVRDEHGTEFDARLALSRRPLDSASLARLLLRYPVMTAQVMAAIHWQALRLWLKRTPVHTHPAKDTAHE